MERENRVVFKGSIARQLLREGYTIVDVKPDRMNSNKSVFVFRNDEGLEDRLFELVKEKQDEASTF